MDQCLTLTSDRMGLPTHVCLITNPLLSLGNDFVELHLSMSVSGTNLSTTTLILLQTDKCMEKQAI